MARRKTTATKAATTARSVGNNRKTVSKGSNLNGNVGNSSAAFDHSADHAGTDSEGQEHHGMKPRMSTVGGNASNVTGGPRRSSRLHSHAQAERVQDRRSPSPEGGASDSSLTDPDPVPAQSPRPPPAPSSRDEQAASAQPGTCVKSSVVLKRKEPPVDVPPANNPPADEQTRSDDVGRSPTDDIDMEDATLPQHRPSEHTTGDCWGLAPVSDGEAEPNGEDADLSEGPGPATQRREALNQLLAGWEGSVRQLRDRELKLNSGAAAAAEELAQAEIGSAFVRFTGPGDIFGVVSLDADPNSRGNPRALNEGHRDLLYEVLRRPNAKRDWESPLSLSVPSHLITEDLRAKMKAHTATDPQSTPPLLKLIREHEEEEIQLENELWLQRENERWLTAEELAVRRQRLDDLRSSRERCMLLNGNHRIRAMLRLGEDIIKIRNEIKDHITKGDLSQDEINEMSDEMWEKVEDHTWRCIVYDLAKLTNMAKTMLVRNQYEKPAMGMGLGEKAWWLAEKFETEIQAELVASTPDEHMDRAAAANIVQERWRREIGSKMLMTGNEEEAEEVKLAQKSKKLGDLAGNDASSRLFFNRLGMDMVLDIRPALWVFETLDRSWAIEMLRPSGAPLLARFWLNARTLINIVNVKDGEGLTDAENWIITHDKLTVDGYADASKYYMALHIKTERVPQLLGCYKDKQANKFAEIFAKQFSKFRDETRPFLDADNEEHTVLLRRVFDAWGKYMSDLGSEDYRRVGASARLYSRLVLHRPGLTGPSFFPTAALPCKSIFQQYFDKWVGLWAVPGNGDCLFLLEHLLSRNSILWTIGAQGNSKSVNWANWYHRLRGLHQIVALLVECKALGSVEARLCEALTILEDPRLPMSLHAVEESFKEGKSFRDLMRKFSAMKGGSFHYIGAQTLVETYEDQVGSFEDFSARVGKARSAIKLITWTEDVGKVAKGKGKKKAASTLDDVLGQHEVLSIVHPSFWQQAHPDWFTGWRDSEPKRMATVGAGIGWALLDKWLVDTVIPELFLDARARWTMWMADRVLITCGQEPWWQGIFEPRKLPARPSVLPDFVKEYSRSKARKDALADKKRKNEGDAGVVPPKKPRNKDTAPTPGAKEPTRGASGSNAASKTKVPKTRSSVQNQKSPEQYPSDIDEDLGDPDGGNGPTPHEDHLASMAPGKVSAKRVETPAKGSSNLAPIVPGVEEFDLSFADRTNLPDHGRAVQPPPKGFLYHHQTSLRPVPHVLVPPIVSSRMPHNSWRQFCVVRDALKPTPQTAEKLKQTVINSLQLTGSELRAVLCAIWEERSNLRSGLVDLWTFVRQLHVCAEASLMLMADMAAGLRDIFVVRDEEALHEATRMASADGMFDCEFLTVTPEGRVHLDLTCTFPKDLQARVRRYSTFISPALGISETERNTTSRLFRFIMPARAMGRNQLESRERAVRAIEHQAVLRNRISQAPNAVHGLCLGADDDPALPTQTDPRGSAPRPNVSPGAADWKSVEPAIAPAHSNASPWSWGDFLPNKFPSNAFTRAGGTREIEKAFALREPEYRAAWKDSMEEELVDWVEYFHTLVLDDNGGGAQLQTPTDASGRLSQHGPRANRSRTTPRASQGSDVQHRSQHAPNNMRARDTAASDMHERANTGFAWSSSQVPRVLGGEEPTITSSPFLGNSSRIPRILAPDSEPAAEVDDDDTYMVIPSNQEAAARQNQVAIKNRSEGKQAADEADFAAKARMSVMPMSRDGPALSPRVVDSGPDDSDSESCKSNSAPEKSGAERQYQSLFTQPDATKTNAPGMPQAPKPIRVSGGLELPPGATRYSVAADDKAHRRIIDGA
ncbi:hypothetical protein FRC06_007718 [Ceratobasidium sp. 370]|nr:hypothetical protein FRC06_007718 [Ceratobasidium sp. 370]